MSGNHLHKIAKIFMCNFMVFVQSSLKTDFRDGDVFVENYLPVYSCLKVFLLYLEQMPHFTKMREKSMIS